MKLLPTSHAARVQPYLWVLRDAGIDVERALDRVNLPSTILYDPNLVIPSRKVSEFICKVAREQGIEEIAVLGANREGIGNLEPWVKSYLLGASTVKQLLERYRKLTRIYVPYRRFWVENDRRHLRICSKVGPDLEAGDWLRLSDWSQVVLLLKVLRHVMGPDFRPTSIGFQTKGALTAQQRAALQGIHVTQGQMATSLAMPETVLAAPLPKMSSKKPEINKAISDSVEPSFPHLMRELLKPCLSENWLNINVAADMADCSVRTFQRRLAKAGLNYSELLDQSRIDVAKALLEDRTAKIIDISLEVGYEDPAHFCRTFRRVNGLTPTQYRKSTSEQAAVNQY